MSTFLFQSSLKCVLKLEQLKRRKRSISHHRSERSAELGVESGYEVVSEADLAFSPEDEDLNVAVLKVYLNLAFDFAYEYFESQSASI